MKHAKVAISLRKSDRTLAILCDFTFDKFMFNTSIITECTTSFYKENLNMRSNRIIGIAFILSIALLIQLASSKKCFPYAFAYIPNNGDNNLSVIKVLDNSDAGIIGLEAGPYGVAKDEDNVYVTNSSDGTVSIISIVYSALIKSFNVGNSPRGVAVSSDGLFIYVANNSDDTLSIIDISNNSQSTIDVGDGPLGAAMSPDDAYLYVTNNLDNSLSIISLDSNELFVTLSNHYYIDYYNDTDDIAFDEPYGVTVSPDGYYVFVVNSGNNTLSVLYTGVIYSEDDDFDWDDYDPDDDEEGPYGLYEPIEVGNDPRCVAISPDQGYAYVTNYSDNTVSVIDLSDFEVTNTISVGEGPYGISIAPSGDFLYVVNRLSGTVSVIDTDYDGDDEDDTVIATVNVGNSPVGFGSFVAGKTPETPSNLEASLKSDYKIKVTWDDNSDDELGFRIARKRYSSGIYSLIATLEKDETEYIDDGLEANSNYYYKVSAYNYTGESDYSNEDYATTGETSSGCFIATAAYGSYDHPDVILLRKVRDSYLAKFCLLPLATLVSIITCALLTDLQQ